MIDLHTHTTASDGTYSPEELVRAAKEAQLDALAITDHDTFAGYEEALPVAAEAGLELVCGIELSTKMPVPGKPHGKSVHLLGYFPVKPPSEELREWISCCRIRAATGTSAWPRGCGSWGWRSPLMR